MGDKPENPPTEKVLIVDGQHVTAQGVRNLWHQIADSRAQPMPMRDIFAAHALAGMLADTEVRGHGNLGDFADQCARESYCIANAMLKEREKGS